GRRYARADPGANRGVLAVSQHGDAAVGAEALPTELEGRSTISRGGWAPWAFRIGSVGAVLLIWELYGRAQETTLFFVPFTSVVGALWEQIQTAEFWDAYRQTFIPFVWGWLLSLAVGIALGLLIGRFRTFDALTKPYLTFLNALPVSTLVPIAVILLGIGYASRILVVFLFGVVEVTLNTAAGVRYVSRDLVEMGESFNASQWQLFRKVIFPASVPGIMAGVRIGTGRAVVGMVVVEILLVAVGMGRLILRYRGRFQSADLYAVVLALIIFGILLQVIARRIERRASRWKYEMEQTA
ncbi:MAG TPA: ABC transporter permease, partial [Acidimicrobiia bacterium]|nr:ABC transporter permease [Acidimicrobiia bacterium]